MGAATGRDGMIYVTDMDRIEVSNLSRQFLFRDSDVGNPKSVSAARVVKEWNPQLNITAFEKKVGSDTEDFFGDSFWESLDVCWNALGMLNFGAVRLHCSVPIFRLSLLCYSPAT